MAETEPAGVPDTAAPLPMPPTLPTTSWILVAILAIVSGVAIWAISEPLRGRYQGKASAVQTQSGPTMMVRDEDQAIADTKNGMLFAGIAGGLIGSVLGMAGGGIRRAWAAGLTGAALGGMLGAALGVAASRILLPIYFGQVADPEAKLSGELMASMMTRGGIWGAIGLAGGMALAAGMGRWDRMAMAMVSALIGGMMAAAFYELMGAAAFPSFKTSQPIATHWAPRLMAALSIALGVALMAAAGVSSSGRRKRPASPPA
ncbi:MAG: hypothetical protein U0800_03885 [Isosphaeraceae bacterium]